MSSSQLFNAYEQDGIAAVYPRRVSSSIPWLLMEVNRMLKVFPSTPINLPSLAPEYAGYGSYEGIQEVLQAGLPEGYVAHHSGEGFFWIRSCVSQPAHA